MSDVRCPSCGDVFRIPDVPLPDQAMAACPWCGNRLPSSELRKALPPLALLVDSDGQPLTAVWSGSASLPAAAAESSAVAEVPDFEDFSAVADSPDGPPFPAHDDLGTNELGTNDLPADDLVADDLTAGDTPAAAGFLSSDSPEPLSEAGWETDEELPQDELSGQKLADSEFADDELSDAETTFAERDPDAFPDDSEDDAELVFGSSQLPRPLENVSSSEFGEQTVPMPYAMPYARPKQPNKSFAPLKTLFGIVLGGLLAVPLAGIFLALMGRPLDLGFWPFLGNADPPVPSRIASQPMEPRQRPRPTGRSMLTDDGRNPLESENEEADPPFRPAFSEATPEATPEGSEEAAASTPDDEFALPPLPDQDASQSPPAAISPEPALPTATAQSEPEPGVSEPSPTPRTSSKPPELTLPPVTDPPAQPTTETGTDSKPSPPRPEPPRPEPPVALTPPAIDALATAPELPSIELTRPDEPTPPAQPDPTDSPAEPDRDADMPVARISAESADATDSSKPRTASAIAETSEGGTPTKTPIPARLKPFIDEINTARERLFAMEDSDDAVTLRRRWAELYVGLAKLAVVATPADRIPLENLSKQLSDDELIDALSRMSPNWLRIGRRPSEGVLLVGTIEQSDGKSFIRWDEDSAVELQGIDETVAGTSGQLLALGKILTSGSQAVVEITFARPLDR